MCSAKFLQCRCRLDGTYIAFELWAVSVGFEPHDDIGSTTIEAFVLSDISHTFCSVMLRNGGSRPVSHFDVLLSLGLSTHAGCA